MQQHTCAVIHLAAFGSPETTEELLKKFQKNLRYQVVLEQLSQSFTLVKQIMKIIFWWINFINIYFPQPMNATHSGEYMFIFTQSKLDTIQGIAIMFWDMKKIWGIKRY